MNRVYRALISLSILGLVGCAGNQNITERNQKLTNPQSVRNAVDRNNNINKMDITNQGGNVNLKNTGDAQGLSKEYHGHFSNRPEANLQKEKPPAADNRYIQVQLLGINDLHGQLDVTRKVNGKPVGRVDYLASYLKQRAAQNKNTIMVHSGDMVGASPPISALLQDEPTIEILNKLNYGIGTVGNHEFDEGVKELLRLINGGTSDKTGYFAGASFPNIVANVVDAKTNNPILSPYKVIKVNGMPIGFIGVVTTDTPNIVIPSGVAGVKFIDEVEAINRYVPELKKQGVKSIVVLAHDPGTSGINGENPTGKLVDMANGVDDEVDIIFGGHNHAYMNATIDSKLVIQAYSYGTAFSDVYLQIDPKTKDIVSKKADIVTTFQEGVTPDPEIKKMVEGYAAKVAPLVNRVIGTTTNSLTALQNANGESVIGDLIADSHRNAMKTDFAFMNPGGIRADIDAGDITWGQAYTVQPFNNALVKMTMTGQQISDVLNQQWKDSSATMLQISGFTYTWDANHPVGQKVTSILLPDKTPIDPNKTYTVTANAFLAGGGDGFTVFNQGQNRETGPIDLDAFVDYLKTLQNPFTYNIDNRIQKVQY